MSLKEIESICKKLNEKYCSPMHFIILASLTYGDREMGALARICEFSTAACTGTIDRLEKQGFVERQHTIEDRRKVMVKITQAGRDKIKTITE